MPTRADLRTAALINIEAIAAGETPSAEDAAEVERNIDNLIASYATDGIYIDPADIPDFVFEELKEVVSFRIAKGFSVNQQLFLGAARAGDLAVRSRLGPKRGTEPIESNYF